MSLRPSRQHRPTEKIRDPNNCGELELTTQQRAHEEAQRKNATVHSEDTGPNTQSSTCPTSELIPAAEAQSPISLLSEDEDAGDSESAGTPITASHLRKRKSVESEDDSIGFDEGEEQSVPEKQVKPHRAVKK
ncbi:hypothetical protein QCA50_014928 [Cerrena zonata]|uniref:Uncharacterized protein n=1 Tax=Cerrena zonata TaxID=2478898 RepID=A0AAW0FSW5_9APHY